MTRFFTNPFGWDWMPKGEEITDITSGETWGWSNQSFFPNWDKWEEHKKIARLFEEIKNVSIKLTFKGDDEVPKGKLTKHGYNHNQITSLGKDYYVNINPSDEKYLTNIAKLEHNISHIVYDSPIKQSRHEAHRLSLGKGIPEDFKSEKYALTADCNLCEEVIRHIYDILEDERVNSLWSDIYVGTSNDYDKCKSKVRRTLKGEPKNPLDALWYAYNGKQFDSEMSIIADKFINAVQQTDFPGGIELTKAYFQNVFLPWLIQQEFENSEKENEKGEPKEHPEGQPKDGIPGPCSGMPGGKKPQDGLPGQNPKLAPKKTPENKPSQTPGNNPSQTPGPCSGMPGGMDGLYKSLKQSIKKVRDRHSAFPDHQGLTTDLNKRKLKKLMKQRSKDDKKKSSKTCPVPANNDKDPTGKFSYNPGTPGGLGKSYDMFDPRKIKELKELGKERNDKLKKKLVSKGIIRDKTLDAYNFDPEQFDIITRHEVSAGGEYNIDNAVANKLKLVWQQAKGGTREIIDDEGDGLDIDAYIQEIPDVCKDNNIYTNDKDEPGLHIVYSADCSGSMDGTPLQILRDVTATIKKSLEFEPKIKMSMIGWGGGNRTGVSVHTKMEDINRFTVMNSYGGTPEANALWYSSTWLQRQPEITKAIFFVSDGAFSVDSAKEQIDAARSHGLNIFGIGICDLSMEKQYRKLFGPGNFTIVDNYRTGMPKLIGVLAKYISRHISSVA